MEVKIMKEKQIIKANLYDIKKIRNIIFGIGIGITSFWYLIYVIPGINELTKDGYSVGSFILFHTSIPLLPFIILGIIFYVASSKISLTVTDKRIYGTAIFGKRIDLPLDMVSAVSTSFFKGIGVSTSSGVIKFWCIKNNLDIHKEISELLLKRQDKNNKLVKETSSSSSADELKKYKKLLDDGTITQEEFDAKKKQLLGL